MTGCCFLRVTYREKAPQTSTSTQGAALSIKPVRDVSGVEDHVEVRGQHRCCRDTTRTHKGAKRSNVIPLKKLDDATQLGEVTFEEGNMEALEGCGGASVCEGGSRGSGRSADGATLYQSNEPWGMFW